MSVYFERPLALADHSNETRAMVQARSVLMEYLLYLKANPLGQEIRHPENLPTSKRILIDTIRVLMAHEPRPEQRGQLRKVGLFLAQFQPSHKPRHPETSEDDALSEWIENVSSNDQRWKRVYLEQERLEELAHLAGGLGKRRAPAGTIATVYVADSPAQHQ